MTPLAILAASALTVTAQAPAPQARTVRDVMAVSLTVEPVCRLSTGALTFGTTGSELLQAQSEAPLALDCTPGTPYSVAIGDGLNGRRRMADPVSGSFVDYDIYSDAGGSRRWGAGLEGAVGGTAPAEGRVLLTAYGRVTSTQAPAGTYADTVTVTVSF